MSISQSRHTVTPTKVSLLALVVLAVVAAVVGIPNTAFASPAANSSPESASFASAPSAAVTLAQATQRVFDDTNAARAQKGLKPFVRNTAIDKVAQAWAEQQGRNGAMSHNPNYSTQIPKGWSRAGENVARNFSYDKVVAAWLASSAHYANIMNDYTDEGIGYYVDAAGNIYWTVNFGTYATTKQPPVPAQPASAAEPGAPAGTALNLQSSSFENSLTGWTASGATFYGPKSDVKGGKYALAVTAASGRSLAQNVTVKTVVNETYTATIWVRPASSSSVAGVLRLSTVGGATETASISFTDSSGWMKVSIPLKIANAGHTALKFEVTYSNSGRAYQFDSASLVRTATK